MVDDVEEEQPKRRKQRKTRGKPTYIDVHVGQRVRQRRTLLGYSQERLADALNLTFQQVQKRLWCVFKPICHVLFVGHITFGDQRSDLFAERAIGIPMIKDDISAHS